MKTTTSILAFIVLVTLWIPRANAGYPYWWKSIATGVSSCVQPGYFADSHDCTRFYRCVDHSTATRPLLVRYDFDCPHGTVFDQGAKVCVHGREGHCGGWGWGWEYPSGWVPPTGKGPYKGGWIPSEPPGKGWGWSPSKGGWVSSREGWIHDHPYDYHEGWGWGWSGGPGPKFWSFTPERSYVIVYDTRGKKRSVPKDLV